jgi:hypothetical protein
MRISPAACRLLAITVIFGSVMLHAAEPDCGCDFKPVKTGLVRGGDKAQALSADVTRVKDLYLVVTFGGDTHSHDQAIWAEPKLIDLEGNSIDLTTLTPSGAQVGWGKLYTNTTQRNSGLTIAGQPFKAGFWAHGPSMLHFRLDGKYKRLKTHVGIDTGAGTSGSVEFEITNVKPEMPAPAVYKGSGGSKRPTLATPKPAAESPHTFHAEGAKKLLARGVDKLVFLRRYTLNANHVYTEYLNSRWTPGGGLCILDLKSGEVKDLVPELNEGVVNRFDVSYDAKRILFDYKKGPHEGYRIYEVNIDDSGLRQLTFPLENEEELVRLYGNGSYHHGTDDMHPCYLPDGGIAFVSTRCQYGILCNAPDVYTTKTVFRMDGDGGNITALSNSPVSEASPAVLPDGRIIYHRWEYVDKAAGNVKCLWAMNPDGTATSEIYGNTITFPETMIYPRPIPGAPGKIVMLGASHCCPNNAMGAVIVIDTSDDIRSVETMKFITDDIRALAHTGFHFRDETGEWKHDKTGTLGRLFKDPYPVSEELYIATRKPKGPTWDAPKDYDLCLLDSQGNETPLYEDEEISCWHPYPLAARKVPPVPVSTPNPKLAKRNEALCVVTDVYQGMDDTERGAVRYLRVLEEVPRPWAIRKAWYKDDRDGMAHSAIGDGFLGLKAQYGIVPVEEDGSAHFVVPAMRNIYFQALDENCRAIQTERTYVHYMPGETRSCIGCHETPNRTQPQPAGVPLAMRRAPSVPGPQPGETTARKLFDYDRDIQPIWDKHCVECHGAENPDGELNLCGDPVGTYSVSYNNLIRLSKGEKQLLGYRKPRDENVGSAGVEYLPPYALGAVTSPLAAMLSDRAIKLQNAKLQAYVDSLAESHKDVRLSGREQLTLTNWLDVNCPFHRSYWGRLHAKYQEHPNYRPEVSFEEALMRTVPKSVAQAEARTEAISGVMER